MYEFLPHDDDTFAVLITEGEYAKCKFLIEQVRFEPIENSDQHKFSYDYTILEGDIEENEEVDSYVGDLILKILEEELDKIEDDNLILEGGE